MKGTIILPKYLEEFWTPDPEHGFEKVLSANAPFFYVMRDTFNFELKYADEVSVPPSTDIIFMFAVPYHNRPNLIPGLLDLDKHIKLIMWPGDIHCHGNELCLKNKIKVFNRCDVIVSPVYEYFVKLYPKFLNKYRYMPKFFAPHDRYVNLPFNDSPKMRCLLSGAAGSKSYPLRSFIKKNGRPMIDHKRAKYVGLRYAKLLNSYFCCATCSSVFNYAVAKYFEVPAAGSLLIADEVEDVKKSGLVAGKHYVPITKSSAIKTISRCLKHPEDYEHIRIEGMKFVRENHSVINRMDMFKTMFEELLR